MTLRDPVRLLAGAGSETERALLRAGACEEPSNEARQRLALALGLPGASHTGDTGDTGDTGKHAPSGASAPVASASLATKWIVLTLGTIAIGSAALVMSSPRAPTPRANADRAAPAASPAPPPPPAAPVAPEPEARAAAEPALAAPDTAPASAARRRKAPAVAQEIAQLDAVRSRLAANQPDAALTVLRDYAKEHPGGVLRQEAALLRIEAWIGKGDRARAQTAAASFLRDNPQSPHANRIRTLLDDAR